MCPFLYASEQKFTHYPWLLRNTLKNSNIEEPFKSHDIELKAPISMFKLMILINTFDADILRSYSL